MDGSDRDWAWPPPGPRRHPQHRGRAIAAVVAVAVAAVASVLAFNAGQGIRTTPANSPLAVSVDPGLVDVTATLGHQQAISAGTGMVLTPSGLAITQQPRNRGRYVHHRHRRTPAAVAGLAPGDVIVSLGGHAVTSAGLRSVIDAYHPGNKTGVVWADLAGQTHAATVVFATGPAG